MLGSVVQLEDLQAITGYQRAADVERCLRDQGIRYFRGRNGVLWTTLGLIEAAGGLSPANTNQTGYPADLVG
jgi:hypothetical protein